MLLLSRKVEHVRNRAAMIPSLPGPLKIKLVRDPCNITIQLCLSSTSWCKTTTHNLVGTEGAGSEPRWHQQGE